MPDLTTADVAVVGDGFSAAAVLVDLVDRLPPEKTIAVVGSRSGFGRGIAYRADADGLRLNVPAARMSMLPGEPDHFVDWLGRRGHPFGPADFAPRALYGTYVRDTVAAALRRTGNRAPVRFVDARATGFAETDDGGIPFRLSNGDVLLAASAVLCLGTEPAGLPLDGGLVDPAALGRVVDDPWRSEWRSGVDPDDAVFIVGTGLTMIDQVLALVRQGIAGRSTRCRATAWCRMATSCRARRRWISTSIPPGPGWRGRSGNCAGPPTASPTGAGSWTASGRSRRRSGARSTTTTAARFLRHLMPFWSVHRHRMSAELRAEIQDLRETGRLVVHKGSLERIDADGERARVRFRQRGSAVRLSFAADHVVACCGDRAVFGRGVRPPGRSRRPRDRGRRSDRHGHPRRRRRRGDRKRRGCPARPPRHGPAHGGTLLRDHGRPRDKGTGGEGRSPDRSALRGLTVRPARSKRLGLGKLELSGAFGYCGERATRRSPPDSTGLSARFRPRPVARFPLRTHVRNRPVGPRC